MDRRSWLGMAVLTGVMALSAGPVAAGTTPARTTKFTPGWVKGEPTLRVEGRGVTFFKRVGPDKVSLRIAVTGEVIELEANTGGTVRVSRQGQSVSVQMSAPFEQNIARVQKLVTGSKALAAFEGLVASLVSDDSLQAQSLRSSHGLLNAVRGVTVAMAPLPAISKPKPRATLAGFKTSAEGPYACWAEYETTMNQYLVIFSSCLDSYWWIPGWTAACAFQFSLQGELAFFWLISCSGGMPV
ncbi:MAG: hypothetical protein Q8N51_02970 [Gammaproteobacteria bacterium]|nr:hypothetical protein [Gammaproteobacteria bacterium]